MDWEFEAEVFQWRGPAPYFFVATPADVDDFLRADLGELTYGWGVIPAAAAATGSIAHCIPSKRFSRSSIPVDSDGPNLPERCRDARTYGVPICDTYYNMLCLI